MTERRHCTPLNGGNTSTNPAATARTGAGGEREPFELEQFIPYRLAVLSGAVGRAMARFCARRFGIAIAEWRTMAVLARFAPLSARVLCERGAMDKVQVSRALAKLIARGLVERATDAQDRRRSSLSLTAAGRRIYKAIVPIARRAEADLLNCLPDSDRRNLDRLLARLMAQVRIIERRYTNAEHDTANQSALALCK